MSLENEQIVYPFHTYHIHSAIQNALVRHIWNSIEKSVHNSVRDEVFRVCMRNPIQAVRVFVNYDMAVRFKFS